jgi:hypothetical protein
MRMKSTTVFLIQLLLWLSVILTGMPTVSAAMLPNQQIQVVQSLEDTLFAVHYDQEPIGDRLNRIEETVFGQAQTGSSVEARINRLQGSLSPKSLGPLSPVNKTAAGQNNSNSSPGNGQPAMAQTGANNSGASAGYTAQQTGPNQPRYNQIPANGNPTSRSAQQIANTSSGTGLKPMTNLNKMQGGGNNTGMKSSVGMPTAAVPEAGETDYPTVTQMELKAFGKTFAKEDITQRLTRLENKVFKMPQTGSLSDRTDNLRLAVLGDTGPAAPATAYSLPNGGYSGAGNNYGQPNPQQASNASYTGYPQPPNYSAGGGYGYNGAASPYGGPPQTGYNTPYSPQGNYGMPNPVASGGGNPIPGYGSPVVSYQPNTLPNNAANPAATSDMMAAMNEVEKEVLGTTYPAEPINTRLDRVENKVFKTTSPEMNPEDRIQRVIAVASAGGAPMTTKAKTKATFQTLLPIILTILPLILL